MKGGFTFCGVDIGDLGIEYAPEIEDTYVYKPSRSNTHEETYDGHNGGYFYGAWKEPKEFKLRCFYEKQIDRGLMAKFYALFKIGKSGRLVFQRRPWIYYNATVVDIDDSGGITYLSGLITITLRAMYPYGRLNNADWNVVDKNKFTYSNTRDHYFEVMQNTALFDKDGMKPVSEYTNIGTGRTIILANPGTEKAPLSISLSGSVGNGVTIKNKTNNTFCRFVAITANNTRQQNKYVYLDGISGKTMLRSNDGTSSQLASLFHDQGFITLDPAFPSTREIYTTYNGTTVDVANILYQDYTGEYIFLNNEWRKIENQTDEHTLTLAEEYALSSSGSERTTIMKMNELEIIPDTSMYLYSLKFIYSPTFA